MEKWQENRNYRKIRDENGTVIANIITVDGRDVAVTEDVFAAYAQMDRRERYLINPPCGSNRGSGKKKPSKKYKKPADFKEISGFPGTP